MSRCVYSDIEHYMSSNPVQVLKAEAQKEPLILFIRNVEKSIIGNFERYIKLESLKDVRLVVIGSHTTDQQKEKVRIWTSKCLYISGLKLEFLLECMCWIAVISSVHHAFSLGIMQHFLSYLSSLFHIRI